MKDLSKVLETKITLSIVYHYQTDRKTEIINQEVKEFLQYYVNYQQDDWTEWLSVQKNTQRRGIHYSNLIMEDTHRKKT